MKNLKRFSWLPLDDWDGNNFPLKAADYLKPNSLAALTYILERGVILEIDRVECHFEAHLEKNRWCFFVDGFQDHSEWYWVKPEYLNFFKFLQAIKYEPIILRADHRITLEGMQEAQ